MEQKNRNSDFGIPALLLRFLGACVYADAAEYYAGLNEPDRAELEAQGKTFCMTAWFYRYLCDALPQEKKTAYQKIYQMQQMKAIIDARERKRLYGVLASRGLRFVPFKGVDLAYRLYPDAALRVYCDWDIWFHPDDCEKALAVLADDGWKKPAFSATAQEVSEEGGVYHYPAHIRGKYIIEPHFVLTNFDEIDVYEMWNCTLDLPDGEGQRVLTPEMNLLMLTRHAATNSYFHARLPKLLCDAAMIMRKEKVDFAKLRELADRWHLPYPGDLLAAFPEFFPADTIAQFNADAKKTGEFRKIFELQDIMGEPDYILLLLSRYKESGNAAGGLLKHFRAQTPGRVRRINHLPEHGAWGRLLWAYLRWFWTRAWRAHSLMQGDHNLQEYASVVENVESAQKPKETEA